MLTNETRPRPLTAQTNAPFRLFPADSRTGLGAALRPLSRRSRAGFRAAGRISPANNPMDRGFTL